jgi:dTDP-4-amino-4,6-dideoxygalactose transaminase
MKKIHELSVQYGFKILEDASHAIGANYFGEPVGNCKFSDITVFSFHPVKIITTGEGGMAVTNNAELANKMELLRSHGITRDPAKMTQAPDGPWYYQQIDLGFNYRMTDIQAALGYSQLSRIKTMVSTRHSIARTYNEILADLPVVLPQQLPNSYSSFHLYVIRLQLNQIKITHKFFFESLRSAGIGINLHYIPIHLQPYFRKDSRDYYLPESVRYYSEAISLPIYSTFNDKQQDTVVKAIRKLI